MKNILLGNGINIQFGGKAYTSNFIMKRIKYRAVLESYNQLFGNEFSSKEIVSLLNNFVGEANFILKGEYDSYIDDDLTAEAVLDFKKRYNSGIVNSYDIMLEDWFLVVHMFFLKNIDLNENRISAIQGFEQLILDAIYNGGHIQEIHKKMVANKKVRRYFQSFDNIFTLNYDNNLEKITSNPVYHLHGDFNVLSNSENIENVLGYIRNEDGETVFFDEMKHCFCNALLNYSGTLKKKMINDSHQLIKKSESFNLLYESDAKFRFQLKQLQSEKPLEYRMIMTKIKHPELNMATEYYLNKFENIEGELSILGMSPNNDAHIFDAILNNPKIKKVIFYYFDEEEKLYIESQFPGDLFESRKVETLWKTLNCIKAKYKFNYSMPKNMQQFIDVFNSLSTDEVSTSRVIDEVNRISQFEMIRLCKLVKEDMLQRNPNHTSTNEEAFIQQNASISYIALQEGLLPTALYMICVMNFEYIKD